MQPLKRHLDIKNKFLENTDFNTSENFLLIAGVDQKTKKGSQVQGLALAKWSKAPDWELRSKTVGSISNPTSCFSTLYWKKNQLNSY